MVRGQSPIPFSVTGEPGEAYLASIKCWMVRPTAPGGVYYSVRKGSHRPPSLCAIRNSYYFPSTPFPAGSRQNENEPEAGHGWKRRLVRTDSIDFSQNNIDGDGCQWGRLQRNRFSTAAAPVCRDFARSEAAQGEERSSCYVFERRCAGHFDEPWTLSSRETALQRSMPRLHGVKCVQKHSTASAPLPGPFHCGQSPGRLGQQLLKGGSSALGFRKHKDSPG